MFNIGRSSGSDKEGKILSQDFLFKFFYLYIYSQCENLILNYFLFNLISFDTISLAHNDLKVKLSKIMLVSMEHLIALLTFQCYQIPLAPRMFSDWNLEVRIFAQNTELNMNWLLPSFSYNYLYNK